MSPPNHPLHDVSDGQEHLEWYACEHPERPHSLDWTAYWSECNACNIALEAAAVNKPWLLGFGVDYRTPQDPSGHRYVRLIDAIGGVDGYHP